MDRARSLLLTTAACTASIAVGVELVRCLRQDRSYSEASVCHTREDEPQCAHWSIFRASQLLGIVTGLGEVQRRLPNASGGHSLAQLADVLTQLGIASDGYCDDWKTLAKATFPCIAHLKDPDHFVVVSGVEPQRGYVHIFDHEGQRTRQRRATFERRWTGITLHLRRDETMAVSEGDIQFDHLLLDLGDIPAVGEPVEFSFPFHNTGSDDLLIKNVQVSCGCLKGEKPETPIPPCYGSNSLVDSTGGQITLIDPA